MNQTPVERAIAEAGSGVALAKIAGVSPMAISYWKVRGIPAHQVLKIEVATGISRHELRPDIYPEAAPTLNVNLRAISPSGESDDPAVISSSTGGAL